MSSARKIGIASCVVGLTLAAIVQLEGPSLRPPLYDGVVTVDPYRFLQSAGTEAGGAQGATRTIPVTGGTSPVIALGTPEQPPQAQLIAGAGALLLPAGATSLVVTIAPVAPAASPPSGTIAGNVYRVGVADQAGAAVEPAPGTQVTLALRDPGSTGLVQIELLSGGTWRSLPTVSAAVSGTYETTGLSTLGDFALVGSGPPGEASPSVSPYAMVTGLAIAVAVVAFVALFLRDRRRAKVR